MKQSGLIKREQMQKFAMKETYIQFTCDLWMITLNDPEYVGKDRFGAERLAKIMQGVSKNYDLYHEALEYTVESDVYQSKLDRVLGKILGDKLVPFNKRYEFIRKNKY